MTDNEVASHAGAMRLVAGAASLVTRVLPTGALMTGLLLAGCSQNPPAAGSRLRVYAADLTGAAKVCEVPHVNPVAGAGSDAPMKVGNNGGWCGILVHQDGPKPFGAGLLTSRPNHGTVLIHGVGDDTRIDYTPDRGFTGNDAFVVTLLPGKATIRVSVTVSSQG